MADIERVVSGIARIPSQSISTSDINRLKQLEDELKQTVFGQDEAIHSLVASIKRSRAGLGSPEKTIGSFLFTGPTGVGKTEVSKQLASSLGVQFIRFDMSEYMEKHTVARLIGAPRDTSASTRGDCSQTVSGSIRTAFCSWMKSKKHTLIFSVFSFR